MRRAGWLYFFERNVLVYGYGANTGGARVVTRFETKRAIGIRRSGCFTEGRNEAGGYKKICRTIYLIVILELLDLC